MITVLTVSNWIPYALATYLLGSIPFGKLIARRVSGIDITQRGSGNIGATNVSRELGLKWGVLTLVLDVLKALIPLFIFACYAPQSCASDKMLVSGVGLCALLGHQFSVFQRLRGGKGVATALGIYLGTSVLTLLSCFIAVPLFFLTVYKWKYVSLGSMVSASAIPVLLLFFGESHTIVIASLIIAALICIKHRDNIERLLKGEEKKWKAKKTYS